MRRNSLAGFLDDFGSMLTPKSRRGNFRRIRRAVALEKRLGGARLPGFVAVTDAEITEAYIARLRRCERDERRGGG